MDPHTLAGKRVLIAEDEPVIAMDHAAQLVQAGAKIVATCATVQGAVDCLREKPIDGAVIDFVLADGNSERLQAALKRKHIHSSWSARTRAPWCAPNQARRFCRSP